VSLIARYFESRGLPTLILGSALDILEAGRPPRAQFLNFPLGFEAGPYQDKTLQLSILREALKGFESFTSPKVKTLPFSWEQGWRLVNDRENASGKAVGDDQRSARDDQPQYQTEEDRLIAEQAGRA
jgi:hypothetical protein